MSLQFLGRIVEVGVDAGVAVGQGVGVAVGVGRGGATHWLLVQLQVLFEGQENPEVLPQQHISV